MTLRKKILTILIFTAIVVTIFREAGIVHIEYYKMTSHTTLSNHWTNKTVTVTIDSSIMGTKFPNHQFHELPIVVLEAGDTVFKEGAQNKNPIMITLDTLETGFLWTPIYKSSTFAVTGRSVFRSDLTKTTTARISLVQADLTGQLRLKGSIKIVSICSHRQAVNLLKAIAIENFVSETKRYFSELD